jgi:hypothetical protein
MNTLKAATSQPGGSGNTARKKQDFYSGKSLPTNHSSAGTSVECQTEPGDEFPKRKGFAVKALVREIGGPCQNGGLLTSVRVDEFLALSTRCNLAGDTSQPLRRGEQSANST